MISLFLFFIAALSQGENPVETQVGEVLQSLRKLSRLSAEDADAAVLKLKGMGKPVLPAIQQSLKDSNSAVVIVCARVLGKMGDESSFEALAQTLQGKLPHDAVVSCLEALFQLNPAKGMDTTIALLDHSSGGVRAASTAVLTGKQFSTEQVNMLLELSKNKRDETRQRALELLPDQSSDSVADRALGALSDSAPSVASAAAEICAHLPSTKLREKLQTAVLESFPDRNWCYATLALNRRLELKGEGLDDAKLVEKLRGLLGSRDPFVAGAASVLLCQLEFYESNWELSKDLDRDIPDVMVKTLAQNVYYRDFTSLLPQVLHKLQWLSGEYQIRAGADWASWWLAKRPEFRANRAIYQRVETPVFAILLERARSDSKDQRALEALARLAGFDCSQEKDCLDRYKSWWAEHQNEKPEQWFWLAAQKAGVKPPEAAESFEKNSFPKLIRLLVHPEWPLRAQSGYWLTKTTGKSFGLIQKNTPLSECQRIANAYQKFLSVNAETETPK